MNIMISWCSYFNRIVKHVIFVLAASQEEWFCFEMWGLVMVKYTASKAADTGTASTAYTRTNDMRPESGDLAS